MLTEKGTTLKMAVDKLLQTQSTPVLVMDRSLIREKFAEFRRHFPGDRICYALKCNPIQDIVELLQDSGCDFEISSLGELEQLLSLHVPSERIISGNPVKDPAFIRAAYASGIDVFAFDSVPEIEKIAALAPGARVYVRLAVSNEGSEWPLSRKFGVEAGPAADLLIRARDSGLDPQGITFHVGSQCLRPATWAEAIEKSRAVWDAASRQGLRLHALNVGGGFPAEYTRPVPSTAEIASVIKDSLNRHFPEPIEITVAPGRGLVADAGILAASVVARADRESEKWLYLDVGVFNGLMEAVGGMKYTVVADRAGEEMEFVLAGPSCDSFDVITHEARLPDIKVGDNVYILTAGAYTTAYASQFDGFPLPRVCMVG